MLTPNSTLFLNRSSSQIVLSSINAIFEINAPINASPAPIVSTVTTFLPGQWKDDFGPGTLCRPYAPSLPQVTMSFALGLH